MSVHVEFTQTLINMPSRTRVDVKILSELKFVLWLSILHIAHRLYFKGGRVTFTLFRASSFVFHGRNEGMGWERLECLQEY